MIGSNSSLSVYIEVTCDQVPVMSGTIRLYGARRVFFFKLLGTSVSLTARKLEAFREA